MAEPQINSARRPAFTLVELILVMALLAIVIALAAPALSRFFRGRTLHSEAGRFLALTRYGQSQSVSAGVPMVLWINYAAGSYGLREEAGYHSSPGQFRLRALESDRSGDPQEWDYQLANDLSFEVDNHQPMTNQVVAIRFSPDGSIDESSLKYLLIWDRDEEAIAIRQSRNRLKYEITDQTNQWAQNYP